MANAQKQGQPVVAYNVPSIASMKLYSGSANEIHIDNIGDFFTCPSCTVNEVNIFLGVGGRKWKKKEIRVNADSLLDGTSNKVLTSSEKSLIPTISTKVPQSRVLTINGVSLDLSSDRSWTITGSGTLSGRLSADSIIESAVNKVLTSAERNKLSGISPGATANSSDAALLALGNHTGVLPAVSIVEDATRRFVTDAEKAKLAATTGTNSGDQDLTPYATVSSVALKASVASVLPKADSVRVKELIKDSADAMRLLIGSSGTTDLSFAAVAYAATVSKAYDPARPNFSITTGGNLSLSVTGTTSGNSGIVRIVKTGGNETLTFNGNIVGSTSYPTGAGSVVWMTYINDGSNINWFPGNSASTGGSGTVTGLAIENASTFTTIGDSSTQRLVKVAADQTHGDSLSFYFHNGTSLSRILTSVAVPTPYPGAPTAGVVDDNANTFNWTHPTGYTTTDQETTINGGTSYQAATKPLTVGDAALANGQVGVRVKAATGRNASSTLFNTTPFTTSAVVDDGSAAFVTGQTLGALRSNFTGRLGIVTDLTYADVMITHLGRWMVAGNTQSHTLALHNQGGDIQFASTVLNMSGKTPGAMAYQPLQYGYVVPNGQYMHITSTEVSGGDQWYDLHNFTSTGIFNLFGNSVNLVMNYAPGSTYGPVDFKYKTSWTSTDITDLAGGVATSSTGDAPLAVDNDDNTSFQSAFFVGDGSDPQWWQWDAGSGNSRTPYAFSFKTSRPNSPGSDNIYVPNNFEIWGSNDGTFATKTVLTSVAGLSVTGDIFRTFVFRNQEQAFRYIRINVVNVGAPNQPFQLTEVKILSLRD